MEFKERYVFGEGYPAMIAQVIRGIDTVVGYTVIDSPEKKDRPIKPLENLPKELLSEDCPKYRLVLEKI